MALFHRLQVYHHSQLQVRYVADLTRNLRFGDLANQMRRSAISVVSNLVEGSGRISHRDAARLLAIARASNDELAAQLEIAANLTGADLQDVLNLNAITGRQLSGLIRYRDREP
jgi:four helix bundle protein